MKRSGYFSTYNRAIAFRMWEKSQFFKDTDVDVSKTVLGVSGAGEAMLLSSIVHWWRGDEFAMPTIPPIKYDFGAWSKPNKPSIHIRDLLSC